MTSSSSKGRHTGLEGRTLRAFTDIFNRISKEEGALTDTFIDDIVDDFIRVASSDNSIAEAIVKRLKIGIDIDVARELVSKDMTPTEVFTHKQIMDSLSTSDLLGGLSRGDINSWAGKNSSPSDVFSSKDLESWAEDNGFVPGDRLLMDRVHE